MNTTINIGGRHMTPAQLPDLSGDDWADGAAAGTEAAFDPPQEVETK